MESSPIKVQSEWLTLLENLFARTQVITLTTVSGTLSITQRQRVRDYCEANLAEKITLDELAASCDMERFKFLKLFKKTVGMTPHAWLIRLRLERACSLLSQPDWHLTRVAHEVGFYDQSHFSHAFRQAFGVPPSRY